MSLISLKNLKTLIKKKLHTDSFERKRGELSS